MNQFSRVGGGAPATIPDAWNPADRGSVNLVLSNNNRTVSNTAGASGAAAIRAVKTHSTGKYYWEILTGSFTGNAFDGNGIGAMTTVVGGPPYPNDAAQVWVRQDGLVFNGVTSAGFNVGALANQTIGFAVDYDAKKMWVRSTASGNVWMPGGGADPATGVGGMDVTATFGGNLVAAYMSGDNSTTDVATINIPPTFTAPANYSAP